MLMKRNDGDLPGPLEGLAEERITRARAIKLAGAAAATGAFALFWGTDEADARRRKRRRRRRRRRRKARVSQPTPITLVPGDNIISITNPSDKPLTISEVRVIGKDGSVIETVPLAEDIIIQPRDTLPVTVDLSGLTATELLQADGLRLIDGRGVPITIVDEEGVKVGVGDIDVL